MKNIVITGANRGIGLKLAQSYAKADHRVWGLCRQAPDLGSGVTWIQADVRDIASMEAAANTIDACDLLICNAGVYLDKGMDLFATKGSEWADTFAVNVEGVFRTVQAFQNTLSDGSKIAIISSIMASSSRAPGGSYIYRASKAAVTNLACNLASDFRSRGIAVGSYHPGWVKTDMGTDAADIDVSTSVNGLMARFEALSLDTTGVFEAYDGTAMQF